MNTANQDQAGGGIPRRLFLVAAPVAAMAAAQDQPPATTQRSPGRSREQVEILREMLREREARRPILPTSPPQRDVDRGGTEETDNLLPDGYAITQRSGRLLEADGTPVFEFDSFGPGPGLTRLQVLPNEILESMERAVTHQGARSFVISGEATRYRGMNYVLVKLATTRAGESNITP